MKILGLGGSIHDYSACLLIDGEIRYAVEDERITRIKHSLGHDLDRIGSQAAEYCMQAAGITEEDLDLVICNDFVDPRYYSAFAKKIFMMNHHLSHAASAFYVSPFEEAAILVADGVGSKTGGDQAETVTYYYGKGTEMNELHKVTGASNWDNQLLKIENSLGYFYDVLSNGIGFTNLTNGKTMGLAPYGTTRFIQDFNSFYTMDDNGNFKQTKVQIRSMFAFMTRALTAASSPDEEFQLKADLAYAGQFHLEQVMIKACRYLYNLTGSKNLCLAGGVALNSVANYKILEETPFEQLFIQPAAGDAGTSIGSALYGYHHVLMQPREKVISHFSPYLGREYAAEEIQQVIERYRDQLIVEVPQDLYATTARRISEGNIIGWFQGRSEIGPRALGHRSILADARRQEMKDTINHRIKHRESFRPFAPIIMEERQTEYFSTAHPSYHMLLVPFIHEHKRNEVPSIVHHDGTGRVQTVSKKLAPDLHRLLSEFDSLTGTPILLNTSFNDNGEPIVETPQDAINCFMHIDLDYLVIDQYILSKKQRDPEKANS